MADMSRGPDAGGRVGYRGAGEPGEDMARTPRLIVVTAVAVAFVACLANFALGQVGFGIAAIIVGLMVFGAGLSWLGMDRRRVREAERVWPIKHPAR